MKKVFLLLLSVTGLMLCGGELNSGKFRLVMRDNGTAPREIYYDGGKLIRSFFYSWYVRGDWFSDRSRVKDVKIISQNDKQLKIEYSCIDFRIRCEYSFLTDPDALKVEFYFQSFNDVRLGGIDPPGGFYLPLMSSDKRFSHFYQVGKDLSLKLMSKDDFPRMLAGFALDNCVIGITDPEGKEGYFTLIDRRFYDDGKEPTIGHGGLCYAKEVCRIIKKDEVIKGQFYIIPFKNNAAEVISKAVAKFCDPDPAKRWDMLASYRKKQQEPLTTFAVVADNEKFIAAAGGTEYVFPRSPMPQKTIPALKLQSAKNQPVFAQIVLKAKQDLKDLSFAVSFPTIKDARINRIGYAPSDYPGTAFATAGMYPDILQPAPTAELKADSGNASWLLTLMVPENIAPGTHDGEIKILSGKESLGSVKISLQIHDFALPKRSDFRTAFLAWTSAPYKGAFSADKYIADQRKLRITTPVEITAPCDKDGNLLNPDRFRKDLKAVLAAGDTCFRMADVFLWRRMRIKDKVSKEAEAYIKNYTSQVYAIMKETGALPYVWFLMADETHRPELNKKHILWCKWVKEVAPELRIFSTQNHPNFEIAQYADILCGPLSSIQRLQKKYGDTKEYWLYENGFPFTLGQSETIPRSMPLRGKQAKLAGYHQWSSCFWGPEKQTGKFRPGYFHGTAAVYYPPEFGEKGVPVRSMRLINCTQGIIDFDCVAMLEKLIAADPGSADSKEAAEYLANGMKKLYPDVYTITGTSADWDSFRSGVLLRIAKLLKK